MKKEPTLAIQNRTDNMTSAYAAPLIRLSMFKARRSFLGVSMGAGGNEDIDDGGDISDDF